MLLTDVLNVDGYYLFSCWWPACMFLIYQK